MTSRKFSYKRIGQALGLLVLGLARLVGSAGYGSADYGRIGGQIITIAQEQEEPATFEVEAVVNARGGLEVRLTAIPGSPTLQIQFVVRGDTNPHRLVDPGTPISILGIAKEGVTAFRSADDIASLLFFATVPSATVSSTNSTMQSLAQPTPGVVFLFARVDTLILSGPTIRLPRNKVLLIQDDSVDLKYDAVVTWTPTWACCERKLRLGNKKGEAKSRKPSDAKGQWEVKDGDTIITIEFNVTIAFECANAIEREKTCKGDFEAKVIEHPLTTEGIGPKIEVKKDDQGNEKRVPLAKITVSKVSGDPDEPCKDAQGVRDATLRIKYEATYEGRVQVKAGLLINIWVLKDEKRAVRGDHGIWHTVIVGFDTTKQDKKGVFPVTVQDPKMLPEPSKK